MPIVYKGFIAKIDPDAAGKQLQAEVLNSRLPIIVTGQTLPELQTKVKTELDAYIQDSVDAGDEESAQIMGREIQVVISSEVHQLVFSAAEAQGTNLNAWIEDALIEKLARQGYNLPDTYE